MRGTFISDLIHAIESAGAIAPDATSLATRAFSSLQYDWPIVTAAELDALSLSFLNASMDGKHVSGEKCQFLITAQFVANIVHGSCAPLAPSSDSLSLQIQGSYSYLCSCVLLSFMKKLLTLPFQDAAQLLSCYQVESGPDQTATEEDCSFLPKQTQEASTQAEEVSIRESPTMGDDDDEPYEDIYPPSSPSPPAEKSTHRPSDSSPTFSSPNEAWTALKPRILSLASFLSYTPLSHDRVWQEGMGLVHELLRVQGSHIHSQDLTRLMHALVGLISDRLVDSPPHPPHSPLTLGACLEPLWEALGLKALALAPQTIIKRDSKLPLASGEEGGRGGGGELPAEVAAALSLTSRLAQAYTSPPSQLQHHNRGEEVEVLSTGPPSSSSPRGTSGGLKRELWAQVQRHLLDLCAKCLQDLVQTTSPLSQPGSHLHPLRPQRVASTSSICSVLLFYIIHRPGGHDASKQLLQIGIVRSICNLLPKMKGIGPGSEPLRALALLSGATSKEVAEWMMAVPGLHELLLSPLEHEGGSQGEADLLRAHAAIWWIVAGRIKSTPNLLSPTKDDSGHSIRLEDLLYGGSDASCLPRLTLTLRLMHEVHQSCEGRFEWGDKVQERLRGLSNEIAQFMFQSRAQPAVAATGGSDSLFGHEGEVLVEEKEEEEDVEGLSKGVLDGETRLTRRGKQLAPECMRLVKAMIKGGGKTD